MKRFRNSGIWRCLTTTSLFIQQAFPPYAGYRWFIGRCPPHRYHINLCGVRFGTDTDPPPDSDVILQPETAFCRIRPNESPFISWPINDNYCYNQENILYWPVHCYWLCLTSVIMCYLTIFDFFKDNLREKFSICTVNSIITNMCKCTLMWDKRRPHESECSIFLLFNMKPVQRVQLCKHMFTFK